MILGHATENVCDFTFTKTLRVGQCMHVNCRIYSLLIFLSLRDIAWYWAKLVVAGKCVMGLARDSELTRGNLVEVGVQAIPQVNSPSLLD